MTEHVASIHWQRSPVGVGGYSRDHVWFNQAGAQVDASASPLLVPPPLTGTSRFDPEQAFAASIAACHMLFFLSLAEQRGLEARFYSDHASAVLSSTADGKPAITEIRLVPRVEFGSAAPEFETLVSLHAAAHARCFLARSVTARITITPQTED